MCFLGLKVSMSAHARDTNGWVLQHAISKVKKVQPTDSRLSAFSAWVWGREATYGYTWSTKCFSRCTCYRMG